jgi:hypothetical protein
VIRETASRDAAADDDDACGGFQFDLQKKFPYTYAGWGVTEAPAGRK